MDHRKLHILPYEFYSRDSELVAKELLGKYLIKKFNDNYLIAKIVETEAYLASNDPAAHNYFGQTLRNEALYGDAGHVYVHSIRQYFCMDVVTEGIGKPGSVLIRAIEPIQGIDVMKELRHTDDIHNLCSGPGKLCQAFGISLKENMLPVIDPLGEIFLTDPLYQETFEVANTPRVGVVRDDGKKLRYYIGGSTFISRP